MYRTATIAVYDVLDLVFISARVMTYHSTPGTLPPVVEIYSASVVSRGRDDTPLWLWEALQALQSELDQEK